jgi:proteasome lid subunit RPN8/RPN11
VAGFLPLHWVDVGDDLDLIKTAPAQLLDFAEESGSSECCGLILGRATLCELLELTANVAASPYNSFEIDSSMLIRAEKCAREAGWKYWAISTRIQMVRLNRPK